MIVLWLIGLGLMYYPINIIAKKTNINRVFWYMMIGIVAGKDLLDILSVDLYHTDLKKNLFIIVLIITLAKGMLFLNTHVVKTKKLLVLKLSLIPVLLEAIILSAVIYLLIMPGHLLNAILLGMLLSPVSPAVIIPYLTKLIKKKVGAQKGLPSIQLLASSFDDLVSVFVFYGILIFGFSLNINIVLTIITALIIPIVLLYKRFFNFQIEKLKFSVLWTRNYAGAIMFILIGAYVRFDDGISSSLLYALMLLPISMVTRYLGVIYSLRNENLSRKEVMFIFLNNIPKATVQASLGPLALAYGLDYGSEILAISAIYILLTAPLGGILLEKYGEGLIE